ncbi:protein kinase [Myxococcota bacterium]|nr:protein kinase [Myxococcota bacterium]
MAKSLVCHHCGFAPPPGSSALHCPTDGYRLVPVEDHEKSPHDPYLGRTLGERYALIGLLGEGAMGAVYLARQMPLDREVAVKVIRPMALSGNTKAREHLAQRFLREAQLQADFNHHAVVTVLDFGAEPDGTLYMVMERLHGVPLGDVIAAGLEPRVLVGMVVQLLDALGRFHDRGLIHRDIKPDNLMVLEGPPNADGMPRVKLLDFGIAKSIRDGANVKLTQDGTVFGTPEYMAPEQAMGVPDLVDHRADLYAVGAVLYEGLTGTPPFTGGSALAILHRVVNGAVPPLPDTVAPELAAVVMRALAKKRDDRFVDARDMSLALAGAVGLAPDRPPITTGRNRLPSGPQAATGGVGARASLNAPGPAVSAPPPALDPPITLEALGVELTVPDTPSDADLRASEMTAAAEVPAERPTEAQVTVAPPAPRVAPLRSGPADPRDAFSLPDPDDVDSAERALRRRRRPWLWVGLLAILGGGGFGIFRLLERPAAPAPPPVSNEPVRVQVNVRFDAPDAGPVPPSRDAPGVPP